MSRLELLFGSTGRQGPCPRDCPRDTTRTAMTSVQRQWVAVVRARYARARKTSSTAATIQAARREQHVQVIDEVGRFFDDALVALVERRHRDLDRFLPHLARARADALLEQLACTSLRAARARARRSCATAPARSTRRCRCGTSAPPARRARAARRRRSRRAPRRPPACCREVSPLCQYSSRERLQNHASPDSRVRRSASSSIHASISTRPVAGVLHDRRRQLTLHRAPRPRARAAPRAEKSAARDPRAGSTRAAPPARSRAPLRRARAPPAPPDAITGTRHRCGDTAPSAAGRSPRACRRRRSTSAGSRRRRALRPRAPSRRRARAVSVVPARERTRPPSASIATTTACEPSRSASSVTSSGRSSAAELTATLSAPAASSSSASASERTPPPTVNGIASRSATRRTSPTSVARPSSVAFTSRNTSSSAPRVGVRGAELDRVADVAQLLEAHALDDAAARDVQARDQARERDRASSSTPAR